MYCTKCGRKLEEGEVCTCRQNDIVKMQSQSQSKEQLNNVEDHPFKEQVTQQTQNQQNTNSQTNYQYQQNEQSARKTVDITKEAEWVKQKGNAVAQNVKVFLKSVIQILKRPISETERMIMEGTGKEGISLIIEKGIMLTVAVLIMVAYLSNDMPVKMPYGLIMIVMLLFTIGIDFLEAFLLKAFTAVFGGSTTIKSMYTVVGIRAAYNMFIGLIAFILSFVSVVLAVCVCGLIIMFLPCIEYSSYRVAVQLDENKSAYAFAVAQICVVVIAVVLMVFVETSIFRGLFSYILNI